MINQVTTMPDSFHNEVYAEDVSLLSATVAKQKNIGLLHYRTSLYSYAMSLTRSREDSEDLVQETFARAIPGQKDLLAESNMKGWLFTILKHIWFNELRRRRNAPQSISASPDADIFDSIPSDSLGPSEIYMKLFERKQVQESIQGLSPRLREIIVLREYAELSYRDIAAVLGCPMGTVMSRLTRARQKLQVSLSAMA
ncbi:RNA polymerase sigma factor [Terriglobus saanensis]|uniref:RNA polymerase, sigma-24 subunit, ECF subfamily n=1 Tax=Terriglobus saanensis (strain ATCC BAA-1853 / DSM 23119 / SP1PR4) TaxID=401053 RepID=E8V3E5_TERSS|nr:sigma-70 family RNA polymerase sigma factor [Terriglobus saanensis]ADV83558.1 RNA polymerase, sigma-24 subunit, ECF subfamily [Terriglobus saanensis SP1PR4]